MAEIYTITVDGHPNIYNHYAPRKLNIYFSVPDAGVNQDTGILLLIPGFGGHSNSNVYKKMRSTFADQYNLVVVQCDYFGWEFMQQELLEENINNFNDMGIMQALDNISAICMVVEIIKDNGYVFNAGKIMAYGHSQGAYLAYLMNAFAPNLLSHIIDNSAWLFPVYLKSSRFLITNGVRLDFNYLAKQLNPDQELLSLPVLYKHFKNQCVIHSFHGTNDKLITIQDKKDFCLPLRRCFLHEINNDLIDHKMFKSDDHGLDADYLLHFDFVMTQMNLQFKSSKDLTILNHRKETRSNRYIFNYDHGVPALQIEPKKVIHNRV